MNEKARISIRVSDDLAKKIECASKNEYNQNSINRRFTNKERI